MKFLKSWDALAMAALAAWHLIFFLPVTLGQKFFAGDDITSIFLPAASELSRALAERRLPLWTTQLESGFPLFAEGHVAALDPVNLILYRILPLYLAFSYSILFHLIWVSVGMYLFCRSSGLRVLSALLAGFVFGFNGFTLAHIQHLTLQAVVAWLPWLLLFQNQMQRARRTGNPTWVIWFSLSALAIAIQILSGFPQIALIGLILFMLIAIVAPLTWDRREKFSIQPAIISFGIGVASLVWGMGIAAVQWVPAAELLSLSVRAQDLGQEFFTSFSLKPDALTQFIVPYDALGAPILPTMEYFAYFGLLALAFVLAAGLRRDVRTLFWIALGIGGLILALGGSTPIYTLLYYVPVFNRFRVPARFLLLVLFAAAMLAAIGFEEIQNRLHASPRIQRPLRGALIAMAIGLTAMDLAFYAQPFLNSLDKMISLEELTQPSRPIALIDNAALPYRLYTAIYNESLRPNRPLLFGKASPQMNTPLGIDRNELYLATMSFQMLNAMNVRYFTRISAPEPKDETPWQSFEFDLFSQPVPISSTRAAFVEIVSYTDQTQNLSDGFVAGELTLVAANDLSTTLPVRIGVETADWAYDSFAPISAIKHSRPGKAMTFQANLPGKPPFLGREYVARFKIDPMNVVSVKAESFLPYRQWNIERVNLVDESGSAVSLAALAHKNDLALVFKSHAVAMFENRDVLPRAFIVHAAQIVPDDQIIKRMQDPGFDPARVAYLAAGDGLDASGENSASADRVEMIEYAPERVRIRVATDRVGYLLLADSWYPGWVASVDGRDAAIQRADYIFRAVKIDTGEHTIVFEFRPTSVYVGAVVSVLSLVALASFTCYIWFRE